VVFEYDSAAVVERLGFEATARLVQTFGLNSVQNALIRINTPGRAPNGGTDGRYDAPQLLCLRGWGSCHRLVTKEIAPDSRVELGIHKALATG
jgi:hypothetical protein